MLCVRVFFCHCAYIFLLVASCLIFFFVTMSDNYAQLLDLLDKLGYPSFLLGEEETFEGLQEISQDYGLILQALVEVLGNEKKPREDDVILERCKAQGSFFASTVALLSVIMKNDAETTTAEEFVSLAQRVASGVTLIDDIKKYHGWLKQRATTLRLYVELVKQHMSSSGGSVGSAKERFISAARAAASNTSGKTTTRDGKDGAPAGIVPSVPGGMRRREGAAAASAASSVVASIGAESVGDGDGGGRGRNGTLLDGLDDEKFAEAQRIAEIVNKVNSVAPVREDISLPRFLDVSSKTKMCFYESLEFTNYRVHAHYATVVQVVERFVSVIDGVRVHLGSLVEYFDTVAAAIEGFEAELTAKQASLSGGGPVDLEGEEGDYFTIGEVEDELVVVVKQSTVEVAQTLVYGHFVVAMSLLSMLTTHGGALAHLDQVRMSFMQMTNMNRETDRATIVHPSMIEGYIVAKSKGGEVTAFPGVPSLYGWDADNAACDG